MTPEHPPRRPCGCLSAFTSRTALRSRWPGSAYPVGGGVLYTTVAQLEEALS